ncbi:hypothetical protein [Shimia abyssi]|uniref:Uncharacterized protein n=1 Tax=Shimia abyssi TaxID=1662395 RepID=A0A2P8FJD4_9RHOB|nr:hypothetical protein [Shimia abyssi]PSL21824.1 hypothetical protein CLV88_101248 [Shimia abyssi]
MSEVFDKLIESARFFGVEAVKNAVEAHTKDPSRWPLAMLHLVTSFELASKALLAKQHPAFVSEKVEGGEKTVSIQGAFERLQRPEIYGLRLSEKDKKRIFGAVKIRNGIAHGLGTSNAASTEAKFFEVFAYLRDFLSFHLKLNILDEVERKTAVKLLSIKKQVHELEKRATNNLDATELVWYCQECDKDFMVEREGEFLCLYCHWEEPLNACQRCSISIPEWELLNAEELFEWEFSEEKAELITNYGIGEDRVCPSCFKELQEEVDTMAREEEWRYAEEEYQYYLSTKG